MGFRAAFRGFQTHTRSEISHSADVCRNVPRSPLLGYSQNIESRPPDTLLNIEGRKHSGLVVCVGSVPIDSRSGLGAEVAVPIVEIERTNTVFAADTLELYSPFDPIGGVVIHAFNCSPPLRRKDAPQWAVEGNRGA